MLKKQHGTSESAINTVAVAFILMLSLYRLFIGEEFTAKAVKLFVFDVRSQ